MNNINTKRVPCPHCAEMILPEAKRCRFCKEQLGVSKKPLSLRMLYWVWFLSMAIFFVALFFVRRAPVSSSTFWIIVLGLITLGGIIAYLILIVRVLGSLKTVNARWYGLATLVTFLAFFALLFNYDKVEAKLGFSPLKVQQPTVQVFTTPIPIATTLPASKPVQGKTNATGSTASKKITCTGPDGKTFQASQEECDSFNKAWGNTPPPDPNGIVRCNIHPNCGGGYKEMTRASCDQMVCCTVDFNNTVKYTSKDQCAREQQQNNDKAWGETCNAICKLDTSSCANYWQVGTSGMSNCISDMNKQETECLSSCYSRQR